MFAVYSAWASQRPEMDCGKRESLDNSWSFLSSCGVLQRLALSLMLNPAAISNRTLLGKVLRLPLRLLPKGMAIPILRGPAKGLKWIVGSSNHGCWLGTYELEKQAALERFIKPGMTVYDIGAQAGFYTLFFSRLVGGRWRVYAFEPFAENLRYLIAHITMNRLSNVKVVQVALADQTGLADFTVDRGKSQNALVDSGDSPLVVATMRLDELVEDHGFSPPDLLKLDVEGGEALVLEGARLTLERHWPVVFVALHGRRQQETCRLILESLGYELFTLSGQRVATSTIDADEVYALPGRASFARGR